MRNVSWLACCGLLFVSAQASLGQVSSASGSGGSVHRMIIRNGSTQTVHYFSDGVSEREKAALRELERAENEASYVANLQALRQKYVQDELALQARRSTVQQRLYGQTTTTSVAAPTGLAYNPLPGYGAYPYILPPNFINYPGSPRAAYVRPYYGGYGYGAPRAAPATGVVQRTTTTGPGIGYGEKSPLTNALAGTIAQQASTDYAASVERDRQTALALASRSGPVRAALGMPKKGKIAPAGFGDEETAPIVLTLKSGDKVEGGSLREMGDWYVVETSKGTVQVRKTEVVRIDRKKK